MYDFILLWCVIYERVSGMYRPGLSIYEAPDSASNEQGQVSYNIVEEGNIMQK